MSNSQLKYAHLVPENAQEFLVDGVEICCDCGGLETTILTFGLYCRTCRSFRLFTNKVREEHHYRPTGTILDLD